MNTLENFSLDMGLSWTMSKVSPFVLMLILGIVLFYIVRRKLTKKLLKSLAFVIIPIPIVIYFAISPIYEGDFTNEFTIAQKSEARKELKDGHLAIITIPGCTYCYRALDNLKIIKDRVGSKDKLDFIVCSKDVSTLDWYKEKSNNEINVSMAHNISAMSELAGGRYPCFAFVLNSGETRIWSNDGFGVMAKDWIEDNL